MSHWKETTGGQKSSGTDTDHRDMQLDGKRKWFTWLTYQHPLGKPNVLNRMLGEKVVP